MLSKIDYYQLQPVHIFRHWPPYPPAAFFTANSLGAQIDVLYELTDAPDVSQEDAEFYLLLASNLIWLPATTELINKRMAPDDERIDAWVEAQVEAHELDLEAHEFTQNSSFLAWMDKQYED